jgi:kynureninase
MEYQEGLAFARYADKNDSLVGFRDKFYLPVQKSGEPYIYMCGNSLGLQPKSTKSYLEQELIDWKNLGVEGHLHAKHPWMPYHEFLTEKMARLVGALPKEVVVMNTLSVNLHLMMVSFYRPTEKRHKILIESDAFPSDKYAVESQIKFHGFDPEKSLIELAPRDGEELLRAEDIQKVIEEEGDQIALIMIGNTNYYTGQFFDMKKIAEWGHAKGCVVGFDCAHGAGNCLLNLHDSGVDFAVWCTYKYINSGPGSLGGVFIHQRHLDDKELPRFSGWWGHDKETRFKMRDDFNPIPTAEGWQLSNPPILSMAAIMASLDIFDEAGIHNLRAKAIKLTGYMEYLLDQLDNEDIKIITPRDPVQRGSQLSIQVKNADKRLFELITEDGVIADWREPDVIRVAPVALYNSFEDVYNFAEILSKNLSKMN